MSINENSPFSKSVQRVYPEDTSNKVTPEDTSNKVTPEDRAKRVYPTDTSKKVKVKPKTQTWNY